MDGPIAKPVKAAKQRTGMRQRSRKKQAAMKTPEHKAGVDHMGLVAQLPCAACFVMGREQRSPTEVHHFKSGRYGSAKEADTKTMPLCHSHHNKMRPYPGDEDIMGYHNGQRTWEAQFGPDYEFEQWVTEQIAMLDG
jgi:hypothetical protein